MSRESGFAQERPLAYAEPGEAILDVREVPPARRHPLIFGTYEALPDGGSFVLVNDHDPKPLYYQFQAEHTGRFTWDYLERGPETWRVRIRRLSPARETTSRPTTR